MSNSYHGSYRVTRDGTGYWVDVQYGPLRETSWIPNIDRATAERDAKRQLERLRGQQERAA